MRSKLLFLILFSILMFSCQNELDDLKFKLINSSKLTVKLVDSKGTSIANVNIKLYDRETMALNSSSKSPMFPSLQYIFSATTDANGKVEFDDVAAGTYFMLIDSVRIDRITYQPIMQFQMNNAVDKEITIKPEDYVSTFNLTFTKTETIKTNSLVDVSAFNNLNVLLVPRKSFSSSLDIEQLISVAEVNTKTNNNGFVSLKVPSFQSYVAIVYNDDKTVFSILEDNPNTSSDFNPAFYGDKGVSYNYRYTLDAKTLIYSVYGTWKLSIKKPLNSPNQTSPTLMPFVGLNVATIPISSFDSNFPLSVLLQSAELSGKTDANGTVTLSLKSNTSYKIIVYNDEQTVYSRLTSSNSDFFYVNSGETRQANFSIEPTKLLPVLYPKINITLSKTASAYYTSFPKDLTPFSNLQVALLPYTSSNSNASLDELLSQAVASGTTDANGQIFFTLALPWSNDYQFNTYYQIVAYNAAKTAKFVSPSFSVYVESIVSKGYYLNSTSLAGVN